MISQRQAISDLLRKHYGERVSVRNIMRPFVDNPFKDVLCHTARITEIRKELLLPYRLVEGEIRKNGQRHTYYMITNDISNLAPIK